MNMAYWCIVAACFLPYFLVALAKNYPAFDNRQPREMFQNIEGWNKRAYWAHLNAFEALPPFIAAVLTAQQLHADQNTINQLATAFIVARVLHGVFYIVDKPILRFLAWFAGILMVVGLFVSAANS